MSSPLFELFRYRLLEPLRWPETIFWTFLFPALLALALGIAFRQQQPAPQDVAVVAGPEAAALQQALARDPTVKVVVLDAAAADRALRLGKVAIQVVPGTPLRYRFDPTRPEASLAHLTVDRAVQRGHGRSDPVATVSEPVTARGARYIDFLVPGLLGFNLMGGGLWGLGWAITEARTHRLLKRFLATPMRRRDYLLGHMLGRLVFVPLEVVTLLVFARLIFGVGLAGSPLALAAVIVVGALAFAGLGTLLASRAKTLETMSGLINLCTMPMMLLSGVFFSTSRFPDFMQPFIRVLPLTALNDALRAIMGDGASLLAVAPQLLVLVVWGLLSFLVALRLFRWT
jgi:ABC-type multidrug transport system permease subunit